MRRWKCSVCGYIHTGDEPPETCPVCGADRSKFFEINEAGEPISSTLTPKQETPVPSQPKTVSQEDRFADAIYSLHIHPISVHIPNGLLPITVFFTFLSFIFLSETLNITAHYNMMVVLLAMPVVLFSGYKDWKSRYQGILSRPFITKMISGGIVTLTALVIVIWRIINPEIALKPFPSRWIFFLIHLIMLAAATTAGYYGGKIVFRK
jgi:uncharacterized membrane protein